MRQAVTDLHVGLRLQESDTSYLLLLLLLVVKNTFLTDYNGLKGDLYL